MAINKEKKQEIRKKLQKVAKEASAIAFANFHGLSMADTTELRRTLRDEGVGYYVAKKSLIRKAFGEENIQGEIPELSGEIAIAWSDDALAPAREVLNFSKKHKDGFVLVGGIYEGEFRDQNFMMEIASIPSIDVLRGMFVNVIHSPIQRMAIALGEIAKAKA